MSWMECLFFPFVQFSFSNDLWFASLSFLLLAGTCLNQFSVRLQGKTKSSFDWLALLCSNIFLLLLFYSSLEYLFCRFKTAVALISVVPSQALEKVISTIISRAIEDSGNAEIFSSAELEQLQS